MTTRHLKINHKSYYFYDGLINILNYQASNVKLDKKQH